MSVCLLGKDDRDRWDGYVASSSLSTAYHLTVWKDVVERSFGHRTYYLLSERDGKVNGVLPLVQIKSVIFGNFMVSLPYFNYGGICGDSSEVNAELLEAAVNIARAENARHIEFRETSERPYNGLLVKSAKVSMRMHLPGDTEGLFGSLASKLRSQIKRPMKEGMTSRIGREEELDNFYEIFSTNMRDLGTPVYSKHFFKGILAAFPDSTWICTVSTKEGNAVSSGFLVGFREMLEIPWASSLRSANHLSPNMLLYWAVLEFACTKGYRVFDFGRSTPGEGTYRFKEQWGAKPLPLYWHYWLANGRELPEINPKNPKYDLAIRVWKRLPLGLTRLIGPSIVKNIP